MSLDPSTGLMSLSATTAEPLAGRVGTPLRVFLLGATGRTGVRFLAEALARGHFVTIYVRDPARLPRELASASSLRVFAGELEDAERIASAFGATKPDLVVSMLASEKAPYDAVSTGTRSTLLAIERLKLAADAWSGPIPFISIASWGLGPTRVYVTGASRIIADALTALFWRKPRLDFEKQISNLDEAEAAGLVRPILILPPILSNRGATTTYLSGDAARMKDAMRLTKFASRGSVADLCLKVGERAASGASVPSWIAITNP